MAPRGGIGEVAANRMWRALCLTTKISGNYDKINSIDLGRSHRAVRKRYQISASFRHLVVDDKILFVDLPVLVGHFNHQNPLPLSVPWYSILLK